ncbi:glycosyltransferase family 41 protein [Ruegeria sp. HKCCD8929]|uniref:O-linked N-acetylglucosamine transferase, SPINDLY family protein n=1 Tax=Ruegeria sp. HKCCD8929 TaxID=2683006 RepID=UPI001489BDEB|nr:glycosyltransferase family 41 protein [Ruegeria sp. HKCCD8929]
MPSVNLLMRRAQARLRIGHFREAADLYREVLSQDLPAQDTARVRTALGNVSKILGELQVAAKCYEQALTLCPDDVTARYNLAVTLQAMNHSDAAEAQYHSVLKRNPDHVKAWNNLGNLRQEQHQWSKALECFDAALNRQPGYCDALVNKGNALRRMGDHEAAIACLRQALNQAPHSAETCFGLALTLQDAGQPELARDYFLRAHALAPDNDRFLVQALHHLAGLCDWTEMERLNARLETLGTTGQAAPPFSTLALEDHPARQKQRSMAHVQQSIGHPAPALPARGGSEDRKLRIGYVSADFRDHAAAHLLTGTLAAHDKSRFTLFAYALTGCTDAMRDKVSAHFDRFHDISGLSDAQAAALAREDGLDIAIDLMGYTRHNRAALFSRRLAPTQIAWLGYPGTTGARYIDYVIADGTVLPPDRQDSFSEAVISLPHSYFPSDRNRPISDDPQTRAEHSLPENAFVFCCFNNSYKICPRVFAIWMRLLSRTPGSVLWLLRTSERAERNLRHTTRAHGVDDTRLVFADRMPNPQHLARHRLADLFLDTFAYNAHTTAVDALWAGLPVLTRIGDQFSARVAASVLTAAGLPEMITTSDADYESLALALATDPDKLRAIRDRLASNRLTCPLFDTTAHTRYLEGAYTQAHARRAADLPAESFQIPAASPEGKTPD